MEDRKTLFCVKEGDKPQSDSGVQFVGRNQKRDIKGDWIIEHLSLLIIMVIRFLFFSFRAVHNVMQKKSEVDSPNKLYWVAQCLWLSWRK